MAKVNMDPSLICPDCGKAGLVERIDGDGSVYHEHPTVSCGYLMVWTPRAPKGTIWPKTS